MPMESDLPQQLEQRDRERLRAYREHLEFYGGAQWRGSPRQRERRLTFNYVRAFIDKLASYLTDGMSVMVEPWDSSPEAADRSRRGQEALLSIAASNAPWSSSTTRRRSTRRFWATAATRSPGTRSPGMAGTAASG